MIDHATIERILDASDIVEVVQDFVSLKKRGVNYLGNCPFHNEKTPSFTVSPGKQIYKCFGCGKGGSPVNFIMEHESLTYVEALKFLANKYHIEVVEKEETPAQIEERNKRESLMIVSSFAQQYFSNYLMNENDGRTIGLSYFRERGFRDDIIKKFQLGFCPDKKHDFTDAAQKEGYKMEFLEETGLTIKRDDWVRDRFSGRVIFPFHNLAGRVIAFGGRILKNDPKAAKYLNSPESEIYHKSKVLYGIYFAKNAITRSEKCFLVEGYTDVLSLHQSGIENVVASSGTSLTSDQIRLIKRFTNNITVIYDGDQAGIKASLRGIDMILEEGINVKVVPLPEGEDPDSFSRSMNTSSLINYINENETDFIQFKTQLLLKSSENDPVAKARLINDIVRSISVIPDDITRSVYIKECSKMLEVEEQILYNEVRKIKFKLTDEQIQRERRTQQRQVVVPNGAMAREQVVGNPCEVEELALLRLLIRYFRNELFEVVDEDTNEKSMLTVGEYIVGEIQNDELESKDPTIQQIFNDFSVHLEEEYFNPERFFVNHPNNLVNSLVSGLLMDKYTPSTLWTTKGAHLESEENMLSELVPRLIEEYKLRQVKLMIHDLREEIKAASDDRILEILGTIDQLKRIEIQLSEKLNRIITN